jgi:hypothetical protein
MDLRTMRFGHRPACRGQRLGVAHRAGLHQRAPEPPTTNTRPGKTESSRGENHSVAGDLSGRGGCGFAGGAPSSGRAKRVGLVHFSHLGCRYSLQTGPASARDWGLSEP